MMDGWILIDGWMDWIWMDDDGDGCMDSYRQMDGCINVDGWINGWICMDGLDMDE